MILRCRRDGAEEILMNVNIRLVCGLKPAGRQGRESHRIQEEFGGGDAGEGLGGCFLRGDRRRAPGVLEAEGGEVPSEDEVLAALGPLTPIRR